jgi:ferric-dicitrate binding protein FerR (iron transport regulator)
MTDPLNNEIELLIISYLTGSISDDDLCRLNDWIRQDPGNREQFNLLKNTWLLAGYKPENISEHRKEFPGALHRLNEKLERPDSLYKPNRFKFLRLAASWIIFLALGSIITYLYISKNRVAQIAGDSGKVEVHSPLGSRSRITMPDSTLIWLNAGTTISYDKGYGIDERAVDLDGEAYFEVKSDSRHPFIVHTSEIDVRALGTRFNVKAYPEEQNITATLEEGKIDINVPGSGKKKEIIMLKPNENFIYHKKLTGKEEKSEVLTDEPAAGKELQSQNIDVISNVKTELFTSWKDQRWIIEREPFTTLVPMLERRYNMKIIFENPGMRDFKFTGTVENESIGELLNAIKFTAPIEYSIIKDTVRLYLDKDASEKFRSVMSEQK